MYKKLSAYLYLSLLLFILGVIVSCIIKPHGLLANCGVSYFGIYAVTLVPYLVSLIGPAILFVLAAQLLGNKNELMKNFLWAFAILLIGLAITPYSINSFVSALHTTFGSILFASQLLLSGIIAIEYKHHQSLTYLWIIEFIAGVMCALYITPQKGYLIEYQAAFEIAFSTILILYSKLLQD
jgi:hypothetical protein